MEYYYIDYKNVDLAKKELIVEDFEFKHITKVLRKKKGDNLIFTDGNYFVYYAVITKIESSFIRCEICSLEKKKYDHKIKLYLYVSPLKNPSRFEFLVEKAVELGVYEIIPFVSQNSVKKNLSDAYYERIRKLIIKSACQSQRCYFPAFKKIKSLETIKEIKNENSDKIVMYEFANTNNSKEISQIKNQELHLIVGPEGGFTKEEIKILSDQGWKVESLGVRKIRAETAAIASVTRYVFFNN